MGRTLPKPQASQGHNLIGRPDRSIGWVGSDLLGGTSEATRLDPLLGPLQDNGGPTFTMALLPNSAAIDAGEDSVLGVPHNFATDQCGRPRKSGAHVDIGAFEVQAAGAPRLTVTRTTQNRVAVSWPSPSTGFLAPAKHQRR